MKATVTLEFGWHGDEYLKVNTTYKVTVVDDAGANIPRRLDDLLVYQDDFFYTGQKIVRWLCEPIHPEGHEDGVTWHRRQK